MKVIEPIIATYLNSNTDVPETDYAAWSSGTTYSIGNRAIYVDLLNNIHWVIESRVNSNLNHVPTGLSTDTWWNKISNTNAYKVFDTSIASQTTNANSFNIYYNSIGAAPNTYIQSVCLLNVEAKSVMISAITYKGVNAPAPTNVYNKTFNMQSYSGITNLFKYFFTPFKYVSSLVIYDLPNYADLRITVNVENTGATAKCGAVLFGRVSELGKTQYGMGLGIQDYSIKTADEFGGYTITEREYSSEMDISLWLENSEVDGAYALLSARRATPTVYVGADDFNSSIVYGFFDDFRINVQYSQNSICTATFKSLS